MNVRKLLFPIEPKSPPIVRVSVSAFRLNRLSAAVLLSGFGSIAIAAPTDPVVQAGNIEVRAPAATPDGKTQISVLQRGGGDQRGVINWSSFSIGANERVQFYQPTERSSILNRVTGAQASQIDGQLVSYGQVVLVNPNGILIGPGARVDTGSFIASTTNISNENFLAGQLRFDDASQPGQGPNRGRISVANGAQVLSAESSASNSGLLALVAPSVVNDGLLVARLGSVVLGGANKFTLSLNGGLYGFVIDEGVASALVNHRPLGQILADGGRIILSARSVAATLDNLVSSTGFMQALRVGSTANGTIELLAANGSLSAAGAMLASGRSSIQTQGAGNVLISADLSNRANNSATAGGEIQINSAAGATINGNLISDSGPISVTAANGGITMAANTALSSGSGAINLNASGDISAASLLSTGAVSVSSSTGRTTFQQALAAAGGSGLGSLTVRGNTQVVLPGAKVTGDTDIRLAGTAAANSRQVLIGTGATSSGIDGGGAVSIDAAGGSLDLRGSLVAAAAVSLLSDGGRVSSYNNTTSQGFGIQAGAAGLSIGTSARRAGEIATDRMASTGSVGLYSSGVITLNGDIAGPGSSGTNVTPSGAVTVDAGTSATIRGIAAQGPVNLTARAGLLDLTGSISSGGGNITATSPGVTAPPAPFGSPGSTTIKLGADITSNGGDITFNGNVLVDPKLGLGFTSDGYAVNGSRAFSLDASNPPVLSQTTTPYEVSRLTRRWLSIDSGAGKIRFNNDLIGAYSKTDSYPIEPLSETVSGVGFSNLVMRYWLTNYRFTGIKLSFTNTAPNAYIGGRIFDLEVNVPGAPSQTPVYTLDVGRAAPTFSGLARVDLARTDALVGTVYDQFGPGLERGEFESMRNSTLSRAATPGSTGNVDPVFLSPNVPSSTNVWGYATTVNGSSTALHRTVDRVPAYLPGTLSFGCGGCDLRAVLTPNSSGEFRYFWNNTNGGAPPGLADSQLNNSYALTNNFDRPITAVGSAPNRSDATVSDPPSNRVAGLPDAAVPQDLAATNLAVATGAPRSETSDGKENVDSSSISNANNDRTEPNRPILVGGRGLSRSADFGTSASASLFPNVFSYSDHVTLGPDYTYFITDSFGRSFGRRTVRR